VAQLSQLFLLGHIQIRKSKEIEKCKCASCGAYLTHMSYILSSRVKQELRLESGIQ
jgi:hypothetical protein